MELADVAGLYTSNGIWRATGARPAGRVLVRALGAADESTRALAGMFLVQGGKQSLPLLREALAKHEHVAMVLQILGDIGDQQLEPVVTHYIRNPDPDVARAARDALETLHLQAQLRTGQERNSGFQG